MIWTKALTVLQIDGLVPKRRNYDIWSNIVYLRHMYIFIIMHHTERKISPVT